jgi:hypothetical protein
MYVFATYLSEMAKEEEAKKTNLLFNVKADYNMYSVLSQQTYLVAFVTLTK